MLVTEMAGDNICGLCGTEVMPPGIGIGYPGEYAGLGTGEPRSEMVRQFTSNGVATIRQYLTQRIDMLTNMLLD